ncbi:hypothetical protein LSH36_780g02064 [Paralvinella palmiformis]|uniref:SOCS box domain-containing protein n=1 Tax=Paralvinella palmiformis TaxID=53620 RepID=A0AAD9J090_9ANNE|nr:hypothetical protein LSH36_780g02064 [Paralvinella palmiformis]
MHASRDRLQYVDLLLEKEADVNGRDTRNHTALMNVIWRSWSDGEVINDEDLKLCKMILQNKYNVNEVGKKTTWIEYGGPVINMATERGTPTLVDLLLEHGADPDITDDEHNSCVIVAVHQNKTNILARLISWNANLDLSGHLKIDGQRQSITPLRCAIAQRRTEAAMLLLLGDCDITKETYLWTNDNVPEGLVVNLELWSWMREFAFEPRPLLWLCRRKIRQMMDKRLWINIHQLLLPPYLETVIKMKDILGPWF